MDSRNCENSEKCKWYQERKRFNQVETSDSIKMPLAKSERNRLYRKLVKMRKKLENSVHPVIQMSVLMKEMKLSRVVI